MTDDEIQGIEERVQHPYHGMVLPNPPQPRDDELVLTIEEQVGDLRGELAYADTRADALEKAIETAQHDILLLLKERQEEALPEKPDSFEEIWGRLVADPADDSVPINLEMRDRYRACRNDVAMLLAYVNKQEVIDDLSKVAKLDGSKPYAVVPQTVLARLMTGANIAVEYANHKAALRGAMSRPDGVVNQRLTLKLFELENSLRVAHGLQPLPFLVKG